MYLNCHTFHSLRYGTISVNELVQSAARSGVDTLCLTDINTMTAIFEFLQVCKSVGIKPIVGIEFRVDEELLLYRTGQK
ncbi:PHP domain-containing protein [Pedobacter agri]|uniref:PHP domain-containing protein n=1 Tax=Pedobacter agri TaxID=454586 RepID=UPI002930FB93|nr:PHP domain-containing protein [Pedobacter agri]